MTAKTKIDRNTPVPKFEPGSEDEKKFWDDMGVSTDAPMESGEQNLSPDPNEPNENGEAAGVSANTSSDATDEVSLHTSSTSPSEPSAPSASTDDTRTSADIDSTRRTVKQRKSELDEYRRRFMQTPKIEDRKPVFVSRRTRDRLDRIVRLLGDRGMSVSGLIENIAIHHLNTHESDIEHWRKM